MAGLILDRGRCRLAVPFAAATLVAAAVLSWMAVSVGAQGTVERDVSEETRRIGQELHCPICEGLSVADSPSQLAIQMRGVIREKLEAGESRDAIMRYFVERYGENILMEPPRSGFNAVIWIAPWLAVAAALAFLGLKVRRAARAPEPTAVTDLSLTPFYEEVDRAYEAVRDEPIR